MHIINEVIFFRGMTVSLHSCVGYRNGLKKRIETKKRKAYDDGLSALFFLFRVDNHVFTVKINQ